MSLKTLVAIDPGDDMSGVVVLQDGNIVEALNLWNAFVWDKVREFSDNGNVVLIVEDIKPYSLRLTPAVIGTCKFIGEVCYRAGINPRVTLELISRYDVKRWVFDAFPEICLPRIEAKIAYRDKWMKSKGRRGLTNKDGTLRKPSFVFVDDRIVQAAMAFYWKVDKPKPGKKNPSGLKSHNWQALACGTCFWVKYQENHA